MPALLIKDEIYGNTPSNDISEITYELIDSKTYDWRVYFPTMSNANGLAHLSFRLQSPSAHSFTTSEWKPVLQLSVKPKANVYGVVNTSLPRNERFASYIDTNGILYINPNVDVTSALVLEIMFIFVVDR